MPRYVGRGSPGIKAPTPTPSYTPPAGRPSDDEIAFRRAQANIGRVPPPPPPPPPPVAAAPTPVAYSAPAPTPRPYNFIASQGLFRADRANLQNTLQETLAQILFDKQRQYRGLETSRGELTREREKGSRAVGEDFAARGLGSSGLYKQALDEALAGYQRTANQLDQVQQDLAQQYGARGSLSAVDPTKLYGDDYTALASIYGLLGQRGTAAGQQYGAALNQARAQAAARAGQSIFSQAGF